jgi:hypothetical protein
MIMRTPLRTLAATLVVAATLACDGSTGPADLPRILGRWDWVESSGGIAGVTLTPESTGQTMLLQFLPVGQVRLFEDGSLTRTVGYQVLGDAQADSTEVAYQPALWGFASQTATFPSDDELVLTDPCCDGFTYRWVRTP